MYILNKDKLLMGYNYQINKYLSIKQPKLREIIELGDKYEHYCTFFIANTEDFMVQLYNVGIKYYEINMYDIFIKQFESEKKIQMSNDYINLKDTLNWWFDNNFNFELKLYNKMPILYDSLTGSILDLYAFEKMSYFVKIINSQRLNNKYEKPGDILLKKLVEKKEKKIERMKKKKQKNYIEYLHDYILSLVGVSNIDIFNVWDLTIYQFYALFRKMQRVKEVDNLNIGIYTGNIDLKKNKIDTDWITDKINHDNIIGELNI